MAARVKPRAFRILNDLSFAQGRILGALSRLKRLDVVMEADRELVGEVQACLKVAARWIERAEREAGRQSRVRVQLLRGGPAESA